MADIPIDTNVIVRYLTETVEDSDCRYKVGFGKLYGLAGETRARINGLINYLKTQTN